MFQTDHLCLTILFIRRTWPDCASLCTVTFTSWGVNSELIYEKGTQDKCCRPKLFLKDTKRKNSFAFTQLLSGRRFKLCSHWLIAQQQMFLKSLLQGGEWIHNHIHLPYCSVLICCKNEGTIKTECYSNRQPNCRSWRIMICQAKASQSSVYRDPHSVSLHRMLRHLLKAMKSTQKARVTQVY